MRGALRGGAAGDRINAGPGNDTVTVRFGPIEASKLTMAVTGSTGTGPGGGVDLARVENQRQGVTADPVRTRCLAVSPAAPGRDGRSGRRPPTRRR